MVAPDLRGPREAVGLGPFVGSPERGALEGLRAVQERLLDLDPDSHLRRLSFVRELLKHRRVAREACATVDA